MCVWLGKGGEPRERYGGRVQRMMKRLSYDGVSCCSRCCCRDHQRANAEDSMGRDRERDMRSGRLCDRRYPRTSSSSGEASKRVLLVLANRSTMVHGARSRRRCCIHTVVRPRVIGHWKAEIYAFDASMLSDTQQLFRPY